MEQRMKIRIFYFQCKHLDQNACSFLLLSQNLHQDIFEFEIHHPEENPDESHFSKPFPQISIPAQQVLRDCKAMIDRYDAWVTETVHDQYEVCPKMGKKNIFITEIPLEGDFYSWEEGDNLYLISMANWNKIIAPPSVLEFILRIVQRHSVVLLYGELHEYHFATRGCLFDFTQNLFDAKFKVLLGYICEDCRNDLVQRLGNDKYETIRRLIGLKWIGKVNKTGTIANILKNSFDYDLDLTKGLKATWQEHTKETLRSAVIQQGVTILATIVVALLLLYFGLR